MTHSSLLSRSACLNEHWSIGPRTEITAGHGRPIEQLPQVSLKQAALERISNQSFPRSLDEPIQYLDRRGVRRLGTQNSRIDTPQPVGHASGMDPQSR
jgi:hypothetical protein